MAKALARADESSGLPRGTLKDTRAKLDSYFNKKSPRTHRTHRKQMARKANNYIREAPTHVLTRELLRRAMEEKERVDDRERKRSARAMRPAK